MGSTSALTLAVVGTVAALAVGVLLGGWLVRDRFRRQPPDPTDGGEPVVDEGAVPPGAAAVLAVLRSSAVLIGPGDTVVHASEPAYELGLVRGDRLVESTLSALVAQVRRDGQIREDELVLERGRLVAPRHLGARVAPLSRRLVLVLVEDRTRERRVEAVRRDFVANVSHELKTPVGALSLLAEAVAQAAGDERAVHRFAGRMRVESRRLEDLVKQVIELSRLQDDELLDEPARVDVDALLAAAVDRSRTDADARHITLAVQECAGLGVRGDASQLLVALGNLVENAVTYSPEGSRVAVSARAVEGASGGMVDITVLDQGIGIPESELDRIFERFYRVDPARATSTGGTGLGLSIVKHVAASHGGEVRVWSVERTGSSFTLSLPAWDEPSASPPQIPQQPASLPRPLRTEESVP